MRQSPQSGAPRALRHRTAIAAAVLAGSALGCATTRSQPDPQTAAQLRVLVQHQEKLQRRLDSLESRLDAIAARSGAPKQAAAADGVSIPKNLSTLRLGPAPRKAPPVPTEVALKEPSPELAGQLLADPDADSAAALPQSEFDVGMSAISNGDVERGAQLLVGFADRNPRDPLAPKALLTAGIGLQNWGEVKRAVFELERVANDYPSSDEAPEALIRLAQCQVRLKRDGAAREFLARVIERYPDSQAARTARAELKNLPAEAASAKAAP